MLRHKLAQQAKHGKKVQVVTTRPRSTKIDVTQTGNNTPGLLTREKWAPGTQRGLGQHSIAQHKHKARNTKHKTNIAGSENKNKRQKKATQTLSLDSF